MTEVLTSKVVMKKTKVSPNWSKADFHGIRSYLANTDWDSLFYNKSADEAWNILKNKINTASETYVPKSTMRRDSEPKWLNREIVKLIRQKKRAWKVFNLYSTAESRDKYKSLEGEVKK